MLSLDPKSFLFDQRIVPATRSLGSSLERQACKGRKYAAPVARSGYSAAPQPNFEPLRGISSGRRTVAPRRGLQDRQRSCNIPKVCSRPACTKGLALRAEPAAPRRPLGLLSSAEQAKRLAFGHLPSYAGHVCGLLSQEQSFCKRLAFGHLAPLRKPYF